MTLLDVESSAKEFKPGTTGWLAHDLAESTIERQWLAGNYELIEGVLTHLPCRGFFEAMSESALVFAAKQHFATGGTRTGTACGVDVILTTSRVVRPDVIYLDRATKARQRAAVAAAGRDPNRTRILVPPTLVIESVSPGREAHDRVTKRQWYAEFGVPNYWILDVFGRSLDCLLLVGGAYKVDAAGRETDVLRPSAFHGLELPLAQVWDD
jgi:hypothetical protein